MTKHATRIVFTIAAASLLFACEDPDPNHLSWKERRAKELAAKQKPAAAEPVQAPEPVKKSSQQLFQERCQECHRFKGRGGEAGPDLTRISRRANSDYVESVICEPASHFPGTGMPSFAGQLTDEEIREIAEYVCGER